MEGLHYAREVNILMNNQQADHLTLLVGGGRTLWIAYLTGLDIAWILYAGLPKETSLLVFLYYQRWK